MGIETNIEALTVATDKNTAMLGELLAAVQGNTAIMQALNDGRKEAIEQLTAKDAEAPKPATRSRKKAEEKADAPEPATEKAETPAASAAWNPDISADGLRAAFTPYLTGTEDADEKKARIANVQAILAELGVQSINPSAGKTHLDTDEDKRKAVFYVTRFAEGLPVNFSADYDFNSDPLRQDAEPEPAGDDDLVG